MPEHDPKIAAQFALLVSQVTSRNDVERLESELPKPLSLEDSIRLEIIRLSSKEFAGDLADEQRHLATLADFLRLYPTPEYEPWYDFFQARSFIHLGDIENAVVRLRKILSQQSVSLRRVQVLAHFWLGVVYNQHGATNEAIECFQACASLAEINDCVGEQAMALRQLASAYTQSGQNAQALELIRQASRLRNGGSDQSGIIGLRMNECSVLLELGNVEEAYSLIRSIHEEVVRTQFIALMSGAEALLARAHYLRGEYEKAKEHVQIAIGYNRARNKHYLLINSLLSYAEILIKTGEYALAHEQLGEAKQVSDRFPNSYHVAGYYELLVSLRTAEGKPQEALEAFREFYDAKQKILSQESERRMALMRIEYHVKEKEREAESYRLRSEQLEKELMNKTGHLVKQAEMLSRFREDMRQIISDTTDPASGIRKIRDKIRDLSSATVDWEEYDKTFSAVHPEFKQHLVSRYPALTPMETKVCTLLRIELTSKEIANLLNISERSVENHRYRARRKIGLGESESMHQFLSSL